MGGEGKTWQRWELYRPRRTAGLYPLSSLCPHYLVLWNEHYTSRWRTVEEYPRYFSFSLSLEIPSTFFFLFLLSFLFFCLFSFRPFLSAISFFLSTSTTPSYTHVKVRFLRFFFFSLSFLSFYIFFSTVFSPIRLFSIQEFLSSDERKGETKNRKRNAIEGGSRGAVTARKACIRNAVEL